MIDIDISKDHNQFKIRTSDTSTNSPDTNGGIGNTAWDNDCLYIKTNAGWMRTVLSTF